eukprot:scaffold39159_cov59-Phaeocystis_antarctica.AAC.5
MACEPIATLYSVYAQTGEQASEPEPYVKPHATRRELRVEVRVALGLDLGLVGPVAAGRALTVAALELLDHVCHAVAEHFGKRREARGVEEVVVHQVDEELRGARVRTARRKRERALGVGVLLRWVVIQDRAAVHRPTSVRRCVWADVVGHADPARHRRGGRAAHLVFHLAATAGSPAMPNCAMKPFTTRKNLMSVKKSPFTSSSKRAAPAGALRGCRWERMIDGACCVQVTSAARTSPDEP